MILRLVGFGVSSSQSSGGSGNSDAKVKAKEEKFRVVSGEHERLRPAHPPLIFVPIMYVQFIENTGGEMKKETLHCRDLYVILSSLWRSIEKKTFIFHA